MVFSWASWDIWKIIFKHAQAINCGYCMTSTWSIHLLKGEISQNYVKLCIHLALLDPPKMGNQIIAIAGSTYSDPCLLFQHSMWQVADAKGTRDSWWNPPMSPPTFAGNMALSGYFQGIMVIMVVNNPLIRPNFLGGCAVLRTVALFCFSFDFLLFSAWKRIYLAKLLYFAKLGFPEIRGFPLLNHHLGWARVRSL